jgi:hypothetical protein
MKTILAAVVAVSLVGGAALAQDAPPEKSTEARLERIEHALARLEQRLSAHGGGGMMEHCREMMRGGMMDGGTMRGGMMGRGERQSPNEQWRDAQ